MSWWTDAPQILFLWLGFSGLSAIIPYLHPTRSFARLTRIGSLSAWVSLLAVLVTVVIANFGPYPIENFCNFLYGVIATLVALVVVISAFRESERTAKNQWLCLALTWCLLADLPCLGEAFAHAQRPGFVAGLFAFAILLIAYKAILRLPFIAIQVINTLILLAIALPIADYVLHPPHTDKIDPATLKKYFAYSAAKRDRAAFAQWWKYYRDQEAQMNGSILVTSNATQATHLRPSSTAKFMDAEISVNSHGFRGREIAQNKGNAYRIVVLGESTTFGYTINAGDKPWPELLEQMIHDNLKLSRPVEVINGGIPSGTLIDNLMRMQDGILPLQPDMIICYHGINGFYLLDKAVPPLTGKPPPPYHDRPLQLLGDAEYGFRLKRYLRELSSSLPPQTHTSVKPTESDYAKAYYQLIGIARTNHIRLVVANFPLAVNAKSPPDLVGFFRERHPSVAASIKANQTFDQMIRELAAQNPELVFVDTHPQLDGEHEKFLDLMHLTQEGDRRLAKTFFSAITNILESDIQPRQIDSTNSQVSIPK